MNWIDWKYVQFQKGGKPHNLVKSTTKNRHCLLSWKREMARIHIVLSQARLRMTQTKTTVRVSFLPSWNSFPVRCRKNHPSECMWAKSSRIIWYMGVVISCILSVFQLFHMLFYNPSTTKRKKPKKSRSNTRLLESRSKVRLENFG